MILNNWTQLGFYINTWSLHLLSAARMVHLKGMNALHFYLSPSLATNQLRTPALSYY